MAKFIGGCADGRDIDVHTTAEHIRVPFELEGEAVLGYPLGSPPYGVDDYRREWIRGQEHNFDVFVERGITPDMMICKLIAGYNPAHASRSAQKAE